MTPTEQILETVRELRQARAKATPGEWDNRCKEFSNSERPRHIWDSTWGFIAECNSGSQDIVNAEFIILASNKMDQLCQALEICVQRLTSIKNNRIAPPYEFSCEEMQEEAKDALTEVAAIISNQYGTKQNEDKV